MNRDLQVAIVVAHPDDETIWAGGTILTNPLWNIYIVSLCRKTDPDRAPKFYQVIKQLGAKGDMGDLDDEPEQIPLPDSEIQEKILKLLPHQTFDLLITHSPKGEYTRHRRHEEIGKAIINMWREQKIDIHKLWLFAYDDHQKQQLPLAIPSAHQYFSYPTAIWEEKYNLVTKTYNFPEEGFEALATSANEAFWEFNNSETAWNFLTD